MTALLNYGARVDGCTNSRPPDDRSWAENILMLGKRVDHAGFVDVNRLRL